MITNVLDEAGKVIGIEILSSILDKEVELADSYWFYRIDGLTRDSIAYLVLVYDENYYAVELEDLFALQNWDRRVVEVHKLKRDKLSSIDDWDIKETFEYQLKRRT